VDNGPSVGQATDTKGAYTVTVTAPTGVTNAQGQVDVSTQASATFAEVIRFNRISISATATAEAGTNAKTYAIFAYAGIGNGNVIDAQFAGAGQVDNGQNGSDACDLIDAGVSISSAQFHIRTSSGILNINGRLIINPCIDNHN